MDNKQRTKKACEQCRKRKTKCSGDHPLCQNCRKHNFECQYQVEDKRRGPQKGYVKALEARLDSLQNLLEDYVDNIIPDDKDKGFSPIKPKAELLVDYDPAPQPQITNIETQNFNPQFVFKPNAKIAANSTSHKRPKIDGSLKLPNKIGHLFVGVDETTSYCGESSALYFFHQAGNKGENYYKIATPNINIHENRTIEEIENNINKELFIEIIDHYFRSFHDFMPIVDKKNIYDRLANFRNMSSFYSNELTRPLVYTIITTASRFFDFNNKYSKLIAKLGAECYTKVVDMAGFLINQPMLSTIQTFLLLSLVPTNKNTFNSWMYSGIAIRLALEIGLHREHICISNNEVYSPEIYQKVWWGCYVLDRLMSVLTGRPAIINDDEYDTTYPESDSEAQVYNSNDDMLNIKYFVKFVQLCNIYGQVLINIYSIKSRNRYTATKLQSRIQQINENIDEWSSDFETNFVNSNQNTELHFSYLCTLQIFYNSLKILIYRPFLPRPETNITPFTHEYFVECTKCAEEIVIIAYNNINLFSKSGTPFKLYPIIISLSIHIIRASLSGTEHQEIKGESKLRILQCIKIMDSVKFQIPIAKRIIIDTIDMLHQHNISLENVFTESNENVFNLQQILIEYVNSRRKETPTKGKNKNLKDMNNKNEHGPREFGTKNQTHKTTNQQDNISTPVGFVVESVNAPQFNIEETEYIQNEFNYQYHQPEYTQVLNNDNNFDQTNSITWDPLYNFDFNFKEFNRFK